MKQSESIIKISAALLKAQKSMGVAKKGANNPYFHSTYADLGSIMEVCKNPLNDNGILVLQPVGHDELGEYVETVLVHESGEFLSDRMKINPGTKPQEQGSAITYARRYALQSMLFIPAEDDDGNAASKTASKKDEPAKTQPPAKTTPAQQTTAPATPATTASGEKMASDSQLKWITAARNKGQIQLTDEQIAALTFQQAVDTIGEIRKALGK